MVNIKNTINPDVKNFSRQKDWYWIFSQIQIHSKAPSVNDKRKGDIIYLNLRIFFDNIVYSLKENPKKLTIMIKKSIMPGIESLLKRLQQ